MRERASGFIFGIAVGALISAVYFFVTKPPALDEPILHVLEALGSPLPYIQHVETETVIGERKLLIRGTYYVDHERRLFDSFATTTLSFVQGDEIGRIAIANRVIGDDVYTLVRTEDSTLGSSVPDTNIWHHFRRGAIPTEYLDISSDRPILDNLVLLRGQGAYLRLTKKHGRVRLDDEDLLRYTFRLSPIALEVRGGTMGAIVSRLGTEGTVDLWVSTENYELRYISLAAPEYRATTTLSIVNTPASLERPQAP